MPQLELAFIAGQGADAADIQAGQALGATRLVTAQRGKSGAGSGRQLRSTAALPHQKLQDSRKPLVC